MVSKKVLLLWIVAAVLLLLAAVLWAAPGLVKVVTNLWTLLMTHDNVGFSAYVRSFGWQGAVILFVLQCVQVFLPIFPEILLQIAAGASYGVIGGTLILMSAYTLCNYTVFLALRYTRWQLPSWIIKSKPWQKCLALFDQHSPETVVFILYLFPFLSNCFVPFMAVQTGISFRHYAWIMILSCLPMMMTSVYLGDRLLAHDWIMAAVAFTVGASVSLVLYLGQNRILRWLKTKT